MTATNIFASERHGCILIGTDAASYDDQGTVLAFQSKVRAFPEKAIAIVGRGNAFGIDTASRELSARFDSFDEMISHVSGELPRIVHGFDLNRPFELILCGFSNARKRPEIFWIRTPGPDSSGQGLQPFVAFPQMPYLLAPWPNDELIVASGYVEPSTNDSPKRIERNFRLLLELQRRVLAEDGAPRVGGWAEITRLTRETITSQIVHRWDDHLGEQMHPEPILWSAFNRKL